MNLKSNGRRSLSWFSQEETTNLWTEGTLEEDEIMSELGTETQEVTDLSRLADLVETDIKLRS